MALLRIRMSYHQLLSFLLLFIFTLESLTITLNNSKNSQNFTSGNHKASIEGKGRRSKQFFLPFVVLPYSSHPQQHQPYQIHQSHQFTYQNHHQQQQPSHFQYNPFQAFFIQPNNFPYQYQYHYPTFSSIQQQQHQHQLSNENHIRPIQESQFHHIQIQPYRQQQQQKQQQPLAIRKDDGQHDKRTTQNTFSSTSSPTTSATTQTQPLRPYIYNRRDVPPVVSIHSALAPLESRQMEESLVVAEPQHENEIIQELKVNFPQPISASTTAATQPSSVKKVTVSCKTKSNQVGTCKRFSECFPMFEVEYGNEEEDKTQVEKQNQGDNNMAQSYMSSPLAEQLVENTNSTNCSQVNDGNGKADYNGSSSQVVCCPRFDFKRVDHRVERLQSGVGSYYGGDRHVMFPPITQRPPLKSVVVSRVYIQKNMCGQSKTLRVPGKIGKKDGIAIPKITGGVEATGPKEFPWMVAVFGRNRRIFCGASLITDRFLLSAAHCFSTFAPSDIKNLYVHLGDYNLRTSFDGPHEVRRIEKVIIHKGFKIETYINDVALIKLDKPVNFTDRIHPICLPEPTVDLMDKFTVVVTGWGRKFRHGVTSDTLRKVEMPVWNWAECKRVYDTFAPGRLLTTNICAGDGKRNKDACLGDSGGPAIYHDGQKWVQVGITSWGKGCGNFPGVYTRVDKFLMWITKNLEQYQ